MTQQHKDILTIIERHGPISTSEICEYLSTLGYGGTMEWQDFRGSISKQLCYLRDKGDIAGEERPQAKGKPLRYWALANPQSDCQSADYSEHDLEMASDVAEAGLVATLDSLDTEREIQERQAVAETPETFTDTCSTTLTTHFKTANKPPISVQNALAGKPQWMGGNEFSNFLLGIEFAEKHHGIS